VKNYELMFVIKPTLTEEELKAGIETVKNSVVATGGEIAVDKDIGIRKLAYEIDKQKRGYYYVSYLSANPDSITEIERQLRINESILRFITIKYESKREVKAWNELVAKTTTLNKGSVKTEAPAPVPTEPVAEKVETPAPTETPESETKTAE